MASTYLTRTFGSAGNQKTFTISFWFKRSNLTSGHFFTYQDASSTIRSDFSIVNDRIAINFNPTESGWGADLAIQDNGSNILFRDVNAWYHLVMAFDTTQSTEANRIKVYVNGVQKTMSGYPSQNFETGYSTAIEHGIGTYIHSPGGNSFDGLMSHFHFIDGTQYDASAFGETDATTGEWKIKTSPSVTYGNNGFFILKDGNSVTDQSGNSNNWTVGGGTLTNTEDCPSNVFATLNPLSIFGGNNSPTLSNGNTTFSTVNSDAHKGLFMSSLGMTQGSGKFYCEIKAEEAQRLAIGVCNKNVFLSSYSPDGQSNQAAITYYYSGHVYYDSNGEVSGASSFANNDILGIALDMENNRLFFHKNGTYMNSGDPTSSTGNVLTFTNASQYLTNHEEMFFFVSDLSSSGTGKALVNFGNGYFGTTAVSSAGTNASGNGIFEYDVPTGYTALSTKGLNL